MPDKSLLKIICLSSLTTGAICGIFPLVPQLTGFIFIIIMFLAAPFVIIDLKRLKIIKELEINKCLLIGGISGFFAFIGFSIIYFPLAMILYFIFKIEALLWIKVLFTNIIFLIPIIILTALLSGLTNMFSAFITVYLTETIKGKKG